jgi:putative ABC transport system permease protein
MMLFLIETFVLGLKNLRLHKLRSLLTAMGIIFGVAAVIIMVAIGAGAQLAAKKQMEQLGAQNILIRSVKPPQSNEASGHTQRTLDYGIRRLDLERLRTLPHLLNVVPMRDTEQKVTHGNYLAAANAIGTTPDVFDVINLRLARGRYFNQIDYENGAGVCVIGDLAARQMFPYEDPLGQTIQVGTSGLSCVELTIIGVLEPNGLRAGSDGAGITNRDLDADVYFPLTLARQTFADVTMKRDSGTFERKQIELTEVWRRTDAVDHVEPTAAMADYIIKSNHAKVDYDVKAPIQILRNAERLNRLFNFIMVGIASFSLVVGGIGIMNIMLATVTERTKEIGIRRALGAKRKHITLQFLIETTVISLSGGLLGIFFGASFAKLLPIVVAYFGSGNYPTSITSWSVIGSFVVSGMIGIGFGLYPAMQAARMNPIEALRHE